MIFRRLPALSSFVLANVRLRALQLDPWPRDGKDQAAARKIQQNSQPSPAAPVATGLDPYALLTVVALMGAADRVERRRTDARRGRPPVASREPC